MATAHRVQTLSLIEIDNIFQSSEGVNIKISAPIKTSRVGAAQPTFFLPFFKERQAACVARVLVFYLKTTEQLRNEIKSFFITFKKPHGAASSQTISRWVKTCLIRSGIDNRFTAHSTRHAATSAADLKGIDINIIKSTAGWSENSRVFARFYKRTVEPNRGTFASTVLGEDL